ncbi:MAG: hypothetical protein NVS9B1_22590 [Candidatus Dormibacteraceae bacterium]
MARKRGSAGVAGQPPGQLIGGEDPGTDRAADARLWVEIYTRLVEFNGELLDRSRRRDAGASLDQHLIRRELERLRARLAFWRERHRRLAPIDLDERLGIVTEAGSLVALTRREIQLLKFLIEHPGHCFNAQTLAARAWQDPNLAPEQVRTYVVRLRRRLSQADSACLIASERGRGYSLVFVREADAAATG